MQCIKILFSSTIAIFNIAKRAQKNDTNSAGKFSHVLNALTILRYRIIVFYDRRKKIEIHPMHV